MKRLMPTARICIAGATGMIGRHLLHVMGDRAVGLVRGDCDLTDADRLAEHLAHHNVGMVVNALGAAAKPWRELFEANAFLARTLAEAAAKVGATCVYLGSARVFDAAMPGARQESDLPDPVDDYGLSKFLGERFTRKALFGGKYFILRMPMVLGCRPGNEDGQIATRLLKRIKAGQPVRAATDVHFHVVHVADVAEALVALEQADAPSGSYHLTSLGQASLHAIISRIFSGCGLPAPGVGQSIDFDVTAPGPRYYLLAPGRLSALLPPRHWAQAVDRFVAELPAARHG
jgi:dTDP-4-dehydrorhamnose reductase